MTIDTDIALLAANIAQCVQDKSVSFEQKLKAFQALTAYLTVVKKVGRGEVEENKASFGNFRERMRVVADEALPPIEDEANG